MIHEINTLAQALIKNEKKYVRLQDSDRHKMKDYKKVIKNYEEQMKLFELDLKQLHDNIKSLKQNEEYLVHDLAKQ
jgi:predicted RNase H-like nuclease (RuvC/YqgF family)